MIALQFFKEKVSAFFDDLIAKRVIHWQQETTLRVETAEDCPRLESLAAFVNHKLFPDERDEVESHLVVCSRCRKIVVMVYRSQKAVPNPLIPPPAEKH